MSRVQLALNVDDLQAAIAYYTKLFDAAPAKVRPGYANFVVVDPPLKLVLIENPDAAGSLNHLGVEVEATEDVARAQRRLAKAGLRTSADNGACCYAMQEKVWVDGPGGEPWEIYAVVGDADEMGKATESVCCAGPERVQLGSHPRALGDPS